MSIAKKAPRRRRGKAKRRGIVLAASEGKIRFADAAARRWLIQFFGRPARSGLLPRKVRQWLSTRDHRNHRTSLIAEKKQTHLYIKEQDSYTNELVILLLELIKSKGEESARRHRQLTRRERQVLFWLRQGKSNSEIGAILQIAPATVNKHLERIYPKLGVENRVAAATMDLHP